MTQALTGLALALGTQGSNRLLSKARLTGRPAVTCAGRRV